VSGEKDLSKLLKTLKPKLHTGRYVFCTIKNIADIDNADVVLIFKEEEGYTIVVDKQLADQLNLAYNFISSWITLTVHSSLEAVGLTSAFSQALANENISCNVVAGYFHDHLFVDERDAERALTILKKLSD
jgi:uncharacterized protein